jgi:hypothetical protein
MATNYRPSEIFTAADYNRETAARYGNLARVAINFAITCDSDTEALYAYLNARWAARLALAIMDGGR